MQLRIQNGSIGILMFPKSSSVSDSMMPLQYYVYAYDNRIAYVMVKIAHGDEGKAIG